jgi:hypothetical protein
MGLELYDPAPPNPESYLVLNITSAEATIFKAESDTPVIKMLKSAGLFSNKVEFGDLKHSPSIDNSISQVAENLRVQMVRMGTAKMNLEKWWPKAMVEESD